ncbi:CPCC family cysteine-rich protein [Agathobaculum hominis]
MSDYRYFPDTEAWLNQENEERDRTPEPYFRPDAIDEDAEEEYDETGLSADFLSEMPTEPCPCCGAVLPEKPSWGYICPGCLWEIDYDGEDDPDAPSDQNNGLSLNEAQMHFRAFGIADPWLLKDE